MSDVGKKPGEGEPFWVASTYQPQEQKRLGTSAAVAWWRRQHLIVKVVLALFALGIVGNALSLAQLGGPRRPAGPPAAVVPVRPGAVQEMLRQLVQISFVRSVRADPSTSTLTIVVEDQWYRAAPYEQQRAVEMFASLYVQARKQEGHRVPEAIYVDVLDGFGTKVASYNALRGVRIERSR